MPRDNWDPNIAADLIRSRADLAGATLPILHALQERFGFIHSDTVPMIADTLNLSRAEVHGTVSFYHDFRGSPAGRHVVKLCRAEACQAVGAVALAAHAQRELGIGWHETTADGRVTLEPVFCLGLCARGPAALVDDQPVSGLDPDAFDRCIAELGQ